MKHIITNTAISLDGKISFERTHHASLGSDEDKRRMSELRAKVSAVLVGGQSFRNWPQIIKPAHGYAVKKTPLYNVILSRGLDFDLSRFKPDSDIKPLFLSSAPETPANFPFEVVVSDKPITPFWIVEVLEQRGIDTLLIEGGGDLIFQFLKAELVDEMYVTVCPKLIGNKQSPTLCDGDGFDGFKNLKLLECDPVGDEIFLHYELVSPY